MAVGLLDNFIKQGNSKVIQSTKTPLNSFINSGNQKMAAATSVVKGNAPYSQAFDSPSQVNPAMGVKAKTPSADVAAPQTTLPAAQAQPLASRTVTPVSPINSSTGKSNADVLAASTAAAQNAAKSIGGSYSQGTGYTAGSTGNTVGGNQDNVPQTFNGLLGQLVSQSNSKNGLAAQGAISGLKGTAVTNPGASGTAYNNYTSDQDQYKKDLMAYNNTENGLRTQAGVPLEFQTGRAGAFQLLNGGRLAAEQAAVTNDLSGVGQNISGTQTQQTGYNQAGNLALTGQSQQLGALGNAITSLQPQLGNYGQTYYNPLQGGAAGGSSLDPQTQASSLAQQVMSGQITYDQALQSLGYAGNVGSTFLNSAITGAGGNPLQLQAQGTTQQGIINTQGTQIAGYQSALQQGQNLQAQVTDLISTLGLNPNDINGVNSAIQTIAKNTSDPRYSILQNYVNDIANTYAQILTPPGSAATDTSRGIASSMLDATASGQSLIQVMKSLDEAAKAKIAGVSTTGGGFTGNSSGSTGGGVVQTQAGAVNTDW